MQENLRIEEMSWTEVKQALDEGYSTIVFGVGSNEQHGPHLPLATDSLFGDWLADAVARRLGKALVAPTIRVGCSEHHMAFPGTITLDAETLQNIVIGYCRSLSQHAFKRIVIIPSHGGNFKPVANAVDKLRELLPGIQIVAYTDLDGLVEVLLKAPERFGISREDSGVHAGEFETSMMLFLRPDLVDMKKAEKGYLGDITGRLDEIIEDGLIRITRNGIIGDATLADVRRGKPYLETLVDEIMRVLRFSANGTAERA